MESARRSIAAVLLTVAGGPLAAAADRADRPGENEQLMRRLETIESRLERLELGADEPSWLAEARAEEIRVLVADVLADADARMALADGKQTAGWDDEFFLASADGKFRVEVSGQLQTRYVWNRRQSPTVQTTQAGFEVRRAKVKLDGHILTPRLGFTVGTAKVGATGVFVLQSFNIRYRLSDELRVFVGRARPPLLREEQVSS